MSACSGSGVLVLECWRLEFWSPGVVLHWDSILNFECCFL